MAIVRKKKNFAPTLKLKRNIQMKKKMPSSGTFDKH